MPIDPVSIAPNRLELTPWRAILNTWAATINLLITEVETNGGDITALEAALAALTSVVAGNTSNIATNTTNISTNTTNIATNTSNIATNAADILLRQIANSKSTVLHGYRARVASDTIISGDINSIILITNTAACTFTVPLGVLNGFTIGHYFIVTNDLLSTDNIIITPTGGVTLNGSTTVAIGESGYFVKVTSTSLLRVF